MWYILLRGAISELWAITKDSESTHNGTVKTMGKARSLGKSQTLQRMAIEWKLQEAFPLTKELSWMTKWQWRYPDCGLWLPSNHTYWPERSPQRVLKIDELTARYNFRKNPWFWNTGTVFIPHFISDTCQYFSVFSFIFILILSWLYWRLSLATRYLVV